MHPRRPVSRALRSYATRLPIAVALVGASTLLSHGARADIKQPDGTTIPSPTGLLQGVFNAAGDPAINVVTDAAITPETFRPACTIKFHLVSRGGAGFMNIFGWYNVTGSKPPVSDLHVLLDCASRPPAAVDLAIRKDPAYKGGDIGFFLVTPENGGFGSCPSLPDNIGSVGGGSKNAIYYSQAELNPDSSAASKHIHLLTYDSKAFKPAFYFAWEDLYDGGDNEFTDFVARVDDIVCAAAGTPCDTGKLGICKLGAQSCVAGATVCVETIEPSAKKCNGLDNDCNGTIDDGPCPDGTICTKGACIPKCGVGEFKCSGGLVCDGGVCVEPSCVGKTCPEGKTCVTGACVDACTGVTCPFDQVCRVGVCVDPCVGVGCGADEVCSKGLCVPSCTCSGCTAPKTCDVPSKKCVDTSCAGKACAKGTHCVAGGACQDDCVGAVCPKGQICKDGACNAVPGGGGDGGISEGGLPDGGFGDSISFDDATGFGDATFDDGGSNDLAPADESLNGGCGCSVPGSTGVDAAAGIVAIAGLAAAVARRRRR